MLNAGGGDQTHYHDATGMEFATLSSDFTSHPYVPTFRFEDKRSGREDGAQVKGHGVQVYGRESRQAPRQEKVVELSNNMMTGQGLHFFIRDHLEELARGEVKQVDFLIPSQGEKYTFRLSRITRPDADPGTLSCKIESDNWLARWFVPSLEVKYELATKRLLSYKGVSNLLSNDKDRQNVVITYRYDDRL